MSSECNKKYTFEFLETQNSNIFISIVTIIVMNISYYVSVLEIVWVNLELIHMEKAYHLTLHFVRLRMLTKR